MEALPASPLWFTMAMTSMPHTLGGLYNCTFQKYGGAMFLTRVAELGPVWCGWNVVVGTKAGRARKGSQKGGDSRCSKTEIPARMGGDILEGVENCEGDLYGEFGKGAARRAATPH